jgi:hypothetical protein
MRKFNNINKVTIAKYAIVGWQAILTSMFVYGFIRVVIGLIMGEFTHVSIGAY